MKKLFPGIRKPIRIDEVSALILASLLSVTAMSLYEERIIRNLAICIMLSFVTFLVCAFVNRKRLAGFFAITGYLIGSLILLRTLISRGERNSGAYFWQWMVSGGDISTLEIEAGSDTFLKYAMYFAVTLFFCITVYYFTVALYRIGFLTLVSLIPFVLYAKVTAEVENRYLVIVVLASALVHLICAGKESPIKLRKKKAGKPQTKRDMIMEEDAAAYEETLASISEERRLGRKSSEILPESKMKGKLSFAFGFAITAAAVLIISAAIPKAGHARYYDRFEDIFLGGDTDSEIAEGFSNLADFSGNADNFRGGSNRRLYTVIGEGEVYLKRQNFDLYDFENDRWYSLPETEKEADISALMEKNKQLSLDKLLDAIRFADVTSLGFAEKYGITVRDSWESFADREVHYTIGAQNFGAAYYLSVSRISHISVPEGEEIYATDQGTFYRKTGIHADNAVYDIYAYNAPEALREWKNYGFMNMSMEESLEMLRGAEEILTEVYEKTGESEVSDAENSRIEAGSYSDTDIIEMIRTLECFKYDLTKAAYYGTLTGAGNQTIPDAISELADSITEGCEYDWQKAVNLEKYFRENDFLYDIRYRAPDDSPEYFLFEGKTGTCSDYASAFVLMARAAGLTVRYAEGFVPEPSYEGMYQVVTESDSHAYAEVFIENTGWLVFDPTAGVRNAEHNGLWDFLGDMDVDMGLIRMLAAITVSLAAAAVIIRFLIPLFSEMFFRISLHFGKPEKAVVRAYLRLLKKARRSGLKAEPTPREFAGILYEKGCDIRLFIDYLEKTEYACRIISEPENNARTYKRIVIKSYKKAAKATRKISKKNQSH